MSDQNTDEAEETAEFDDESDMIVSGDEETAKVAGHDGEIRIYVVDAEQKEWVQSDVTVKDLNMDTDSVGAHERDSDTDEDTEE